MAKIGRLELDVVALTAAFQRDLRRAVDSTNTAAAQMGRRLPRFSAASTVPRLHSGGWRQLYWPWHRPASGRGGAQHGRLG